jgi:hypothetical protein
MDERAQRILAEGFDTVDRLKDLQVEQRDDSDDALARWDAMRPKPERSRPERGLDTDLPALIDAKVAEAIATEREFVLECVGEAIGEMLAEERKAAKVELSDEVRRLRIELSNLETTIAEIRGIIAAEAQRSSATVIDLPNPLRRDLN